MSTTRPATRGLDPRAVIVLVGALALVGLAAALNARPATRPAPSTAPIAGLGATLQNDGWWVRYDSIETPAALGSRRAQGQFVVLSLTVGNKQSSTTALHSWDFELRTPDGATQFLISDQAAYLPGEPRPLVVREEVQPGLSKPIRLVFDANPSIRVYTLKAAGLSFRVALP